MEPIAIDDKGNPKYLFVEPLGVEPYTVALEENNSLFVGTGSNCRIALRGDTVEPIHCMFWMDEEGILRVQDWNTTTGTLLNGSSASDETVLKSGDELEIGGNRIIPVLSHEVHQKFAHVLNRQTDDTDASQVDNDPVPDDQPESPQTASGPVDELPMETSPTNETPDRTPEVQSIGHNSVESASSEFQYDVLADLDSIDPVDPADNPLGNQWGFANPEDRDESQNEEVELLRLEVEQLRFELSERDSMLESSGRTGTSGLDEEEDDQTVQLVNRLESLLEELQDSDARVRGLEDMLRASDQATQAERDERKQLESWVTEIEERVRQRESESEAELARLQALLSEVTFRHKQTQHQLRQVLQSKDSTGTANDASNELVLKLREQVEELEQRLEESSQENSTLQQRVSEADKQGGGEIEIRALEQKLLQQEVESSRERAEMARQRAELEALRGELEDKLRSAKNTGNGDARLQAMREHLREIHAEEKSVQEQKRQRSLSGRISRLLNSVNR